MRGNATLLSEFVEGNKVQFIIPVYQRNYDWLTENCNQLFDDLVNIHETQKEKHFFGSIVTSLGDNFGSNKLVIDGQQRLTTVSLLLLAGIKAVKDSKLPISDQSRLDESKEIFLVAKYSQSSRKIKLQPIENDMIAYDAIFKDDTEHFVESSKVTKNFLHFYDLLVQKSKSFNFDNLLDAIEHLEIINIELEKKDDAQLIFESLNSTGLALTGADQVRNFLLMSLTPEEQILCFKNYWQKIQSYTEDEPTMFLRDYLTITQQLQKHVKITSIYPEWKKYMRGKDRKQELAMMVDLAQYYYQVTHAKLPTKRLSEKMKHICNTDSDVANVFFVQFLKYASENKLAEDEELKVIDIIENYIARRIICNLPTNALTQVFCSIHKDVLKSIDEYRQANMELNYTYSLILIYHIMRRDGNYIMPRDVQFVDTIKTRDAYHMPKPYQIFLFERLENSMPGETNDVAEDMKTKAATIEHIMPQTLNSSWITMLGSDYENIQEKYLHTFANLTLTGINSELSNNEFLVKRDGNTIKDKIIPGYKDSKYRLTKNVVKCDKWTIKELNDRAQEIVDIFLRLYPLPKTEFKPVPKPLDEVSLDEETFSPTNRTIKGYRFFDKEYAETTWKGMLVNIVTIIASQYPEIIDSICDKEGYICTPQKVDMQYYTLISPDKCLLSSVDNKSKLKCLHYLFEKCDIAETELVMLLDFPKDCE